MDPEILFKLFSVAHNLRLSSELILEDDKSYSVSVLSVTHKMINEMVSKNILPNKSRILFLGCDDKNYGTEYNILNTLAGSLIDFGINVNLFDSKQNIENSTFDHRVHLINDSKYFDCKFLQINDHRLPKSTNVYDVVVFFKSPHIYNNFPFEKILTHNSIKLYVEIITSKKSKQNDKIKLNLDENRL